MTSQCSNCKAVFSSPYCPECGQKAGVGRLTMHNIAHELWHGFTHTDKGIFKLFADLLMRPATAYQNYFDGRRKSYFSPVVFFLLSFGLFIYLDQQVYNYEDHITKLRTGHLYNNEIGRFLQEHAKYIALTLLPVEAFLTYAFFYKRHNLAECITFWLFCVGFTNVIMILATPFRLLFITQKSNVDYILSLVVMGVYFWHTIAVFGAGIWNKIKCILLVLIVSIINVYIGFYFLSLIVPGFYPGIWDTLKILFGNKSANYMEGKWIIK
ncbi:MAG: DUF3667 domain-containing protein [Ferruginibacter sp.]